MNFDLDISIGTVLVIGGLIAIISIIFSFYQLEEFNREIL